ncbi:hypothetical protein T492DRAFT_864848 [Pavlovales sp. CCMP2436]|nr:hypothetical protein T492DRAFT_864848 [Pavlovales sp. CCMP2436]
MQALLVCALAFQPNTRMPPVAVRLVPARNLATSSLLSCVFGTHHSLLDTPFALLSRVSEEDFTRSLNLLNLAVSGLALKMTFSDMGLYSKIDDGEGKNKCEATCAVTVPCHVINPWLIKAETLDGKIIVTVPVEAQAANEAGKAIDVKQY